MLKPLGVVALVVGLLWGADARAVEAEQIPTAMQLVAEKLGWTYVPRAIVSARTKEWTPSWKRSMDAYGVALRVAIPTAGLDATKQPAVEACIDAWARHFAVGAPEEPTVADLRLATDTAVAALPGNPLLTWLTVCVDQWQHVPNVVGRLRATRNALAIAGQNPLWFYRSASQLAETLEASNSAGLEAANKRASEAAIALLAVTRKADDAATLRMTAGALEQGLYAGRRWQHEVREAMLGAIAADQAHPWLAKLIVGRVEITKAWESRGGGWSKSVTDDGWKGFREHLALAREALTAAQALRPDLPEAADEMIVVCMGQSSGFEEERQWFDLAIAAECDHHVAYDNLWQAYQPRWGGDYALIMLVGQEAFETKFFDSPLPRQLLRAVMSVDDDLKSLKASRDALWASEGLWPALRDMHEGYLTSGYYGKDSAWLLTGYAGCAWRCHRFREAKALFERLGARADDDQLREWFDAPLKQMLVDVGMGDLVNGPP